jgi:hypothetical protein
MFEFGQCRPFFVVKQRFISKPMNISVFWHDNSPMHIQYPSSHIRFLTATVYQQQTSVKFENGIRSLKTANQT